MNVSRQYEKISKLRTLAEHPETPAAEAFSARRRMEEIEVGIREWQARKRREQDATEVDRSKSDSRKSGKSAFSTLSRLKKKKTKLFPLEWPFGWEQRGDVDIEVMPIESEKKIVLGWKCPCCKLHVERAITPRHRARLMGRDDGVAGFIEEIRVGRVNQLCDSCWYANQ